MRWGIKCHESPNLHASISSISSACIPVACLFLSTAGEHRVSPVVTRPRAAGTAGSQAGSSAGASAVCVVPNCRQAPLVLARPDADALNIHNRAAEALY